jgi:hypothetical protein
MPAIMAVAPDTAHAMAALLVTKWLRIVLRVETLCWVPR